MMAVPHKNNSLLYLVQINAAMSPVLHTRLSVIWSEASRIWYGDVPWMHFFLLCCRMEAALEGFDSVLGSGLIMQNVKQDGVSWRGSLTDFVPEVPLNTDATRRFPPGALSEHFCCGLFSSSLSHTIVAAIIDVWSGNKPENAYLVSKTRVWYACFVDHVSSSVRV